MSKQSTARGYSIVRVYLFWSVGFGAAVGAAFPVYASFFIDFKSADKKILFAAGCLLAGVLVGVSSFLIGRLTVLRFISDLASRLSSLAADEADLSYEIPLRSSDCVGRLADAFNRFLSKLRSLVEQLDEVTDKSRLIGLELAANSTETSAASEQISRHMQQINEQTHLLLNEVDEVDEARRSINEASVRVSENIDTQSDSLTALSALIEDSVSAVRGISSDTENRLSGIREVLALSHDRIGDIDRVAKKMGELREEIERVGSYIATIDDIAERITVLGINASIEAARSGAAGKGFSVVAQEIRKLADLARSNSSSIAERLSAAAESAKTGAELSAESGSALASFLSRIGSAVDEVLRVSERLAGLSGTTQAMLDAHNELVKVSVHLTLSMVGLTDASNSIERSMGVLMETADENKRAIEEISVGIKEISTDVAHLDRVSVQNKEGFLVLSEELARFRLK